MSCSASGSWSANLSASAGRAPPPVEPGGDPAQTSRRRRPTTPGQHEHRDDRTARRWRADRSRIHSCGPQVDPGPLERRLDASSRSPRRCTARSARASSGAGERVAALVRRSRCGLRPAGELVTWLMRRSRCDGAADRGASTTESSEEQRRRRWRRCGPARTGAAPRPARQARRGTRTPAVAAVHRCAAAATSRPAPVGADVERDGRPARNGGTAAVTTHGRGEGGGHEAEGVCAARPRRPRRAVGRRCRRRGSSDWRLPWLLAAGSRPRRAVIRSAARGRPATSAGRCRRRRCRRRRRAPRSAARRSAAAATHAGRARQGGRSPS